MPKHYCFNLHTNINVEVINNVENALKELEKLGACVEEIKIPSLEYAPIANDVIMLSEGFAYHVPRIQTQQQDYGEAFISRLYEGSLFTANDYVQAQRVRNQVKEEFAKVLQKVDLIAMPTMTRLPEPFDEYEHEKITFIPSFTSTFNETGMPAISVPCGFSKNGLPIGLQLAGKPFEEPIVFRAAYTYQQNAKLYKKRPQLIET